MKFTVTRPVELEVSAVRIEIPVRDEEDGMPKDFPHRNGDTWTATVEVDTGKIRDWPSGEFELFEKVVDAGVYTLLDAADREVGQINQDYVPNALIPGKYGDYIDLKIKDGIIANWPKRPIVTQFFPED